MDDPFTHDIIGYCQYVQNHVGVGLPESVYHHCLVSVLRRKGFHVASEVPIPYQFEGEILPIHGRVDLQVSRGERACCVELKSVLELHRSHQGQAIAYARFGGTEGCLLINFGTYPMQIQRFASPAGWKTR